MKIFSFAALIGLFLLSFPIRADINLLHQFAPSNIQGSGPYGDLISDGTFFYGMAAKLGQFNCGTIFRLNGDGSGFFLLHTFAGGGTDGKTPYGSLVLSGTTLYGMTYAGGDSDRGTIFKIETNGNGFTLLHEFAGGAADGANPNGSLIISGTTLYGMTSNGGEIDTGTIFKIEKNGTGFTLLHEFINSIEDGGYPYGSLIISGSTLYGMTQYGGEIDTGTIFKIGTNGTGFTLLHEFTGGADDGRLPGFESLIISGSTLYGTTELGGDNDMGTVFKMETNGSGFTLLYEFAGGTTDGAAPVGSLLLSGSTLYGMTRDGGSTNMGMIYKIGINGTGYTLLHEFAGGANNGDSPQGGSLVLSGSTLYGMTYWGGDDNLGAVFKIEMTGTGFALLHDFAGVSGSDGSSPFGTPILSGTTLYGMTYGGGISNMGMIYKMETNGTGYTSLHDFTNGEGASPRGSLILSGTTLYGVTNAGGSSNLGTIFKIETNGTGFTLLHEFSGVSGSDGSSPFGTPILSGTTLFGMTSLGGISDMGVIYKIETNGTGYTLLHEFTNGEGASPRGSLILSGSTLYGMTYAGGSSNLGTIFKIETNGTGFTLLHEFAGGAGDGNHPYYGSLLLSGSTFYGMTYGGSTSNFGTVFKIGTDGNGFSLLHSFAGGIADGKSPYGSLVLSGTTLYGMTKWGGSDNLGTIFKIETDGSAHTLLHSFAGGSTDGAIPYGSPLLSNDTLFGMISAGGSPNSGVIFSLPLSTITITSPNGGEGWIIGSSHNIAWTSTGAITNVNIDYSTNNGTDWTSVATNEANDGSYSWTVPNAPSTTCLVRVSDTDGNPSDTSNAVFTIAAVVVPSLQLTNPNGAEHWTLGTTKVITWTATNYSGTVRLVLFKNGVRFGNIATNLSAAAGSYSWTVGSTIDAGTAPAGTDYRIYLRSTDNTIVDPSDYRLYLTNPAQLQVTSPNGGESWVSGSQHAITWNANGYSGTVRLILFRKAGKIGQIVTGLPASQGTYLWTVGTHSGGTAPADILYSIRLQATDASQDDFSDGPFAISDGVGLTLTAPNDGVPLKAAEPYRIRWTDDPDVMEVKLEFSRDNGGTFATIADHVEDTGEYEWLVPINFTPNGIVRVTDSGGKAWLDDGLLECAFKFMVGGAGGEPGSTIWFGGSDAQAPGYGFAKIAIGGRQVQFGGVMKEIEPLEGGWHKLRVRFDFRRDTAEIKLDERVLFENAALGTTREHYFQPILVLRSGGAEALDFMIDDLAISVVQLDEAGNDRQRFTALSDTFNRYDEKSNALQSCWKGMSAPGNGIRMELDRENADNKRLRLRTGAGKQLTVFLQFALPDKVPFDISDKNVVIENR